MGSPRPEYWSRLLFLTSGDPPYPEIEPISCISCIDRQILYHCELLHFAVFGWNITSWARSSLIVPLGTLMFLFLPRTKWIPCLYNCFCFFYVSSASPILMNDHRDKKHIYIYIYIYNSVWKKSFSINIFKWKNFWFHLRSSNNIKVSQPHYWWHFGSDNFLSSDL